MSEPVKIPAWYYLFAGLLLIWNLMGIMNWSQHFSATPESIAEMPENQRLLFENYPVWALIFFAMAVFGGANGAVGLLMRKSWAVPAFAVSLVGTFLQAIHPLKVAGKMESGADWVYGMNAAIVLIAMLALLLAILAGKRSWLSK